MNFKLLDQILALITMIISLLGAYILTFLTDQMLYLPDRFAGILMVIIYFVYLTLITALELKIIRFWVPLLSGRFSLENSKEGVSWKLQGFLYVFNLGLFMNSYLVPVNLRAFIYNLLGAKISKFVMIGGKILEPPMVQIGEHSILGEDTLIIGHAVEGETVVLGKVIIGKRVTIGVKSVIMPNVIIGDDSIIASQSLVKKGTRIGEKELWAGIPARKIKDL